MLPPLSLYIFQAIYCTIMSSAWKSDVLSELLHYAMSFHHKDHCVMAPVTLVTTEWWCENRQQTDRTARHHQSELIHPLHQRRTTASNWHHRTRGKLATGGTPVPRLPADRSVGTIPPNFPPTKLAKTPPNYHIYLCVCLLPSAGITTKSRWDRDNGRESLRH